MFDFTDIATRLMGQFSIREPLLWLAQIPDAPNASGVTPEATSIVFSGPQFFIALVSGVLLAFAFQLLLTNLSVAAGISYLGRSSDHSDHHSDHHDSGSNPVKKISTTVGLWTLITVTLALFLACFFAVQLSLLATERLGAIVGLVIWAAYFSILVWISSTTVGSLIGSVVSAATSGFQAILGTATAAIGGKMAQRQVVSTAEAVASAVKNELGSGVDPESIRQSMESYFQRLRLPGFDIPKIRQDFESLLNDPELASLSEDDRLRNIDRQTFVDLISRRTDFSKNEVNRLADLLEGVWRQTLGKRQRSDDRLSELVSYLQSTQPGQMQIDELNAKLDRVLAERSAGQSAQSAQSAQPSGGIQQTIQSGMNTAIGLLMGRTDLSDLDLNKILDRLKTAQSTVTDQTSKVVQQLQGSSPAPSAPSPIRTDIEHYLLNTYSWQMNRETIARDFRNVLYDTEADPSVVIQELSALDRNYFANLLSSRGVFVPSRIEEIVNQLEEIRLEVITEAHAAREREIALDLRARIDIYLLHTPKEQLYSEDILPAFQAILRDEEADTEMLKLRLAPYDRESLRQILLKRPDIMLGEVEAILDPLERTRDRVLFDSQSLDEQAKQRLASTQQKLEDYLRNTGKTELDPDDIKRDLQLLLSDPQTGLSSLRHRAATIDRDTLVKLLSQRQDLTEADANRIVSDVETNWKTFLSSPRIITDTVKEKTDETLTSLADYLRRTDLEELDPDGIQRDLTKLLDNPREGALALRRRLSKIDRETLVRLLSQRQDLSESQVNRLIDQVESAIHKIVRSPRRLALRAQRTVTDFETSLEDYLRNTDKEELNPEGIKRDLKLLTQSPQAGLQNIGDRLSRFDRNTVVALLSQRKDMTPEEAERVVSQFEETRNQIVDQARQIQARLQAVIDRIFGRIRDYLNSLDRPELNYDGIKHDVRTLFDDPQAGFDAMRSRLAHFDRGTLVALLSSREDISEADANRIIDQVESARSSVLQQAERIQNEAQRRVEAVKAQAQRQMEETRKAAEAASWWLFITALVSAIAAAGAGALAAI
ncbi:MFS transporter [Phormidium tenue FACHB-886]|nr:MFS transporter [Phormidium tenue FACHB-886]